MNCSDFERMIPGYLQNELKEKELAQFIQHAASCNACKEEMTIQYLITEGVQRLEDGKTLDVEKELGEKLRQSKRHLRQLRKLKDFLEGLIILLLLCAIAAVIWFFVR
ncbi:MAG: zf-HC2 domain-containing protein [Lachnospiraceae bacterium]|nr:zf-HC2 domain-containing protein [Lachnospiraceae bacterium]